MGLRWGFKNTRFNQLLALISGETRPPPCLAPMSSPAHERFRFKNPTLEPLKPVQMNRTMSKVVFEIKIREENFSVLLLPGRYEKCVP